MELVVEQRAGVEAHLRRLGWIGDQEPLLALERPGEGNMNRTLRARLPGRTLILKQAVPYVAKYPQIAAPVARLEAEAAFYRAIAGCEPLARHTPALLGADPTTHLLCLEDLGEAGDLTMLYREGSDRHRTELAALARWLGALHGLVVDRAAIPDNRDMRLLNHAHVFEVPFEPDHGVPLSPGLARCQARLAEDAALRRRARELGERYLGGCARSGPGVLLHGDYYPGSWLVVPERTVAVIDPEFAFIGPPEFDVGVLTAHLVMASCNADDIAAVRRLYPAPSGFSDALARQFAGMEVIRRLLGVAQLPLAADDATRVDWLNWAAEALRA